MQGMSLQGAPNSVSRRACFLTRSGLELHGEGSFGRDFRGKSAPVQKTIVGRCLTRGGLEPATPDGMQVFSVYGFINLVCRKTGKYANRVWRHLMRDTSKFVEFKEDLVLAVPSTNIMKYTTPGMTVMGLQRLLCILDKKVTEDFRTIVEATQVHAHRS